MSDFYDNKTGKLRMGIFKDRQRSGVKARNRLGYIEADGATVQEYRSSFLNTVDDYYDSEQYCHMPSWEQFMSSDGEMSSREAQPKIVYPFLKVLCDRLSAKLLGQDTYPDLKVEDDPDFQYFAEIVERDMMLKAKVQSALKKLPIMGSCFIRTMITEGMPNIELYDSKYCYPKFIGDDLLELEIRYIYEDTEDRDSKGNPKNKWFKLLLGRETDTHFDNPEYKKGHEPVFTVDYEVDHQLGFVQGVWFRTSYKKDSPDGETFVNKSFLKFIDEFNYNLSKSSNSAEYGVDPQLVIKGMTEDELEDLVKTTSKAWSLGREGDARFLEAGQSGLQASNDFRDRHLEKKIMDIARIVILDPEKIVGSAQSGKAMEVLYGPMLDFINELRPYVEAGIKKLYAKILATLIEMNRRGFKTAFGMPPQYTPKSFDMTFSWPPVFPMTAQDKQQTISYVNQMVSGNIISRETGLVWLKAMIPDIPVDDIGAELQRVATQPQFNTWAGF